MKNAKVVEESQEVIGELLEVADQLEIWSAKLRDELDRLERMLAGGAKKEER